MYIAITDLSAKHSYKRKSQSPFIVPIIRRSKSRSGRLQTDMKQSQSADVKDNLQAPFKRVIDSWWSYAHYLYLLTIIFTTHTCDIRIEPFKGNGNVCIT